MGPKGAAAHIEQRSGVRLCCALALSAIVSLLAVFLTAAGPTHAAVPISFGKSTLHNETSARPTSLQFGPDGRLYVAQQNGLIKIYTIKRNGANDYAVTATQTITKIKSIPNHNDAGTSNTSVTSRLVTGILVRGTRENPVIYVTSSDPRKNDASLDTNS